MKIGIIGASGYTGGELIRLVGGHPEFELKYIAAGSNAGELVTSIHPQLPILAGRTFEETSVANMSACDLLFMALPHGESSKYISKLRADLKIIDLGADFRLSSANSWAKYYGGAHAGTWTYGLPEIAGLRSQIVAANRIANPGCYATAIALATAPAIGVIDPTDIVVVAASGTTGAGRSAKANLLGSEVMNSLSSYKFGGIHQHTPEIEETLEKAGGSGVKVSFTPILAPMPRGILATITAKLLPEFSDSADIEETVRARYRNYFENEQFVILLPKGQLPKTSSVLGSNAIQIQVAVDHHTHRLVISSAIDNLGKGAAGQAIQNANLISGLSENLGLSMSGTP
jgi:N-acetyl-gamma-glutamyl-phosphate reductase